MGVPAVPGAGSPVRRARGKAGERMGKPPKARELYDALRALEGQARTAYNKQESRRYSRREAARKAGGPESTLDRRLAKWLPEAWEEATTPDPGSGDKLLAVVKLWCEWAGKSYDEGWWSTLLDEAQPPRPPTRRRDPAPVSTTTTESDRVDHLHHQVEEIKDRVRTLQDHVLGTEAGDPCLAERVDRLLDLVQRLERRADEEHDRRAKERKRRKKAERRAEEAERQAEEATAEVDAARRQLSAAAEYAKESDALLEHQRGELRQLRLEIEVLQGQVRLLTEENRADAPKGLAGHGARIGAPSVRIQASRALAQSRGEGRTPFEALNDDAPWDAFDPLSYVDHNYRDMLSVDKEIISRVRDHFSDHFQRHGPGPASGIDVGAGANLYPALAMLPWSEEITLLERSPANVEYLRGQCDGYDPRWDQFWDVLCEDPAYAQFGADPRDRFRRAVRIESGNLFDLGDRPGRWDLGTMFFVAESFTTSFDEFRHGVSCFLRALRPGAPFAAAFMENSLGYTVGGVDFPACAVGQTEVAAALETFTQEMRIYRLEAGGRVRAGYAGMLLAYGRRRA
ncbi:SCO2525 family SAM-dependent methyltransferase [Streptomyces sp. NPDC051243]|uniref:SCO2525 family SAM-dependent methyltransferase n=1 Tax=Streptomyces sp. NPDC051243 TaxID=3365646 RepID=UPI003799668E